MCFLPSTLSKQIQRYVYLQRGKPQQVMGDFIPRRCGVIHHAHRTWQHLQLLHGRKLWETGDSKREVFGFLPLRRGVMNILLKGHVFTIPNRSPAELPEFLMFLGFEAVGF